MILDNVSLQIHEGEKICLLGRNGAGKSTFVRLLQNQITPDSGTIGRTKDLVTAMLDQEIPSLEGTIGEIVAHETIKDHAGECDRVLSMCSLDATLEYNTLSAGMKRRVLLAKALAKEPNILLLDEPTNHLDIETIEWLESLLNKLRITVFFVTHDRSFLANVAKRIIEIDRGHLFDWDCGYKIFLERKEAWLAAEAHRNEQFDKKLAEEEAWLRRGIKARRTRNEGRVRALYALREESAARRDLDGTVKLESNQAALSGRMISEAEDVDFAYDKRPIISGFSVRIMRGDHIAIVGRNGCGKSTLVKLLLGLIQPLSGSIRAGSNLEIAYFDQMREGLDGQKTVRQSVTDGGENVSVNGRNRHVVGYLQDFLFTPEKTNEKVSVLSGGEKNRLMLARLFAKPANVLVFDEPTNDLDIETIELLEFLLAEYEGTVITVSHDRDFVNNTCERIFSFEEGTVREYQSLDMMNAAKKARNEKKSESAQSKNIKSEQNSTIDKPKKKLSFNEKKELGGLPAKIETLEARRHEITALLSDPSLYQKEPARVPLLNSELAECDQKLEALFERWESLEAIQNLQS